MVGASDDPGEEQDQAKLVIGKSFNMLGSDSLGNIIGETSVTARRTKRGFASRPVYRTTR